MAGIGLKYLVYATLTENESAGNFAYGTGKRGRKLTQSDVKINYTDDVLHGDDGTGESAKEFTDGSITIAQDELTDTMKTDWLGNASRTLTIGEETVTEIVSKDTDIKPYIGVGYIEPKIIDNARKYRAVFFTKVQFAEPDENFKTKGKNIEWKTSSVVGTIMRRNDSEWKQEATVDNLDTAIAYLKSKVNLT
jgi:phi13 family phage major tail protein